MMERILIIGCGGSGKSTLARALAQRLGLPVCHLDQLYWKSGWENVSQEEFDDRLHTALALPQWIMDGNFERTVATRIQRCDTLIVLDYSRVMWHRKNVFHCSNNLQMVSSIFSWQLMLRRVDCIFQT